MARNQSDKLARQASPQMMLAIVIFELELEPGSARAPVLGDVPPELPGPEDALGGAKWLDSLISLAAFFLDCSLCRYRTVCSIHSQFAGSSVICGGRQSLDVSISEDETESSREALARDASLGNGRSPKIKARRSSSSSITEPGGSL